MRMLLQLLNSMSLLGNEFMKDKTPDVSALLQKSSLLGDDVMNIL